MRLLMLSNPDAVHTAKWANGLAQRQIEVLLLGVQKPQRHHFVSSKYLQFADAGVPQWVTHRGEGSLSKAFYFKAVRKVRQLVREWKPDLIHAHYVSSYGLLGALANVHPYLISVWGSDIYEFPDRSWLHRRSVEWSLKCADRISSTSNVMAKRTSQFTAKKISVVPFGIDLNFFAPQTVARPFTTTDIVIGTVKTLHEKYGIRHLIEAFAILRQRHPFAPLKLLIVGGGPQQSELEQLADQLGLGSHCFFTGFVEPDKVPTYHNMLDIYVALSTVDSESFGVAIIEASSCGKPVVVSDAGGLPEVVVPNQTGFIVPRKNPQAAADALENLIDNPDLRHKLGQAGRAHVAKHYDLERNLDQMIQIYREMVE